MNGLNKFMNGLYKLLAPAVQALFALFITIGANYGITAYKDNKTNDISKMFQDALSDELGIAAPKSTSSGGTGFATFIQILMWLIAIVFICCKALEVYKAISENPQALNSLKAPAQNNVYAQPQQNFAQPVQNNIPAQQNIPTPAAAPIPTTAPAAGADRFCTQCGSRVPAGNSFCTGCGAKLD